MAVTRTRSAVLRRLENIVVAYRLRKTTALPTRYFHRARREKQLITVFPSLTRRFDQKTKDSPCGCLFYYAEVAVTRTRSAVLRRLENIVVAYRLRKSAALPTRYFHRARHEKQLSTVFPSLTRHIRPERPF